METNFNSFYSKHAVWLRQYLFHKIANTEDAQDLFQEIMLAAYRGFSGLRESESFRPWLRGIASRKCADYYRIKATKLEIPLDSLLELPVDEHGNEIARTVLDTLNLLNDKDKQILYLFYIQGYCQKDIALMLNIPTGTVKSRVSTAKESFRKAFHDENTDENNISIIKGDNQMNKQTKSFPNIMPNFIIERSSLPPFSVEFEEISGWPLTLYAGEKAQFAFYDDPGGIITDINTMECVCPANIHGVPCFKVDVTETEIADNSVRKKSLFLRRSDTHVSYVAELLQEDKGYQFSSFMDDEWIERYKVGEDNIGREIHQEPKGIAVLKDDGSFTVKKDECPDIFGRYDVTINSRTYDTVALLEIYGGDHLTILYINKSGKTILFRRYNRFDWKQERYGMLWTEKLPDSERLIINGSEFVHWYDCIGDWVL